MRRFKTFISVTDNIRRCGIIPNLKAYKRLNEHVRIISLVLSTFIDSSIDCLLSHNFFIYCNKLNNILLPFYAPVTKYLWVYQFTPVRLSVRPYLYTQISSSYSFGNITLIFCRMIIHIMKVCKITGFCFLSNILNKTGSCTFLVQAV